MLGYPPSFIPGETDLLTGGIDQQRAGSRAGSHPLATIKQEALCN